MKTFEEALRTVARFASDPGHTGLNPADVLGRYNEIAQEAASDRTADAMLKCVAFSIEQGRMTLLQGLFALFMNGVVVGIEMEKHQFVARTPKAEADHKP